MGSIIDENNFWLDVLSDHMQIFLSTLNNDEYQLLDTIKIIKSKIDKLLEVSMIDIDVSESAVELVEEVQMVKRNILDRMVRPPFVKINLSPTFVNHMLNELDEYKLILSHYKETDKVMNRDILEVHRLWLKDACGHASVLIDGLDVVETTMRKELKKHKKKFSFLYERCEEFIGYAMRIYGSPFVSLKKLDSDSELQIKLFIDLLNEIYENRIEGLLLGNLEPFLIEHMLKEEEYYLRKIIINMNKK